MVDDIYRNKAKKTGLKKIEAAFIISAIFNLVSVEDLCQMSYCGSFAPATTHISGNGPVITLMKRNPGKKIYVLGYL